MAYMREQAARLSRGHDLAKAIQYMLKLLEPFPSTMPLRPIISSRTARTSGSYY
jgi:hypothetical protein